MWVFVVVLVFFGMVCVYVVGRWCFVYFGNIQGLGMLICNVDVCG